MNNKSNVRKLLKHSPEHDCAILTAYRPDETKKNNHKNIELLGYALKKIGYASVKVFGTLNHDEQIDESIYHSWFVVNKNDDSKFFDNICELGKINNQNSILYIPRKNPPSATSVFLRNNPPFIYVLNDDKNDAEQKIYASGFTKFGKSSSNVIETFLITICGVPFYFTFELDIISEGEQLHSPLYVMELIDIEIKKKYKSIFK